ncbi:MAG: hypothetical protein QOK23_4061 [Gammaproteobacteria bacterium]|jgi:hypothetical protein|nr:hypothetical protein [Gammaproteobacteria bacterium]
MKKELLATFAFLTIGAFQIAAADEPTTAAVNAADHAALMQWATERGFKQDHGKDRYCRSVTPIGTRFSKTTCLTEVQLAQAKESEPPTTGWSPAAAKP